ncbi:hypothetical protein GQ600_26857 [Phytophthora cactorum]|nr:hypothetical protein GQ600_26857 [Phytophthora cactorum]
MVNSSFSNKKVFVFKIVVLVGSALQRETCKQVEARVNGDPSAGDVEVDTSTNGVGVSSSPRTRDADAVTGSEREARTPARLTPQRTWTSQRRSTPRTRVSPYPERVRTPATIGQRDASGVTLDDVTVRGASWSDIITSLFDQLRGHIKGRAIKTNGEWSLQTPFQEEWHKLMQFRFKRHMIETTKIEKAFGQWVKSARRQTVQLLVYEYVLSIKNAQDLQEFKEACTQPPETDRAGAAAESTLHDVVNQLQQRWGSTFQGSAIANAITRNLNRSTWTEAISVPPPEHVANFLNAADSLLEQHISNLNRSSRLALHLCRSKVRHQAQQSETVPKLGITRTD